MELEEGIGNRYMIIGNRKDIEFSCTVGRTKDNEYLVTVYPIRISKK